MTITAAKICMSQRELNPAMMLLTVLLFTMRNLVVQMTYAQAKNLYHQSQPCLKNVLYRTSKPLKPFVDRTNPLVWQALGTSIRYCLVNYSF